MVAIVTPLGISTEEHNDVVVVGAGPVGLTTALSLGNKGAKVLVLEAATAPIQHPQAHFIHQSSAEVLRQLGVLPAVLEAAPAAADWQRFVYCRDMSAAPIAVRDHFTDEAAAALERASPVSVVHLAQSKLVGILLDAADAHPNVTVQFGRRVTAVKEVPDSGVEIVAADWDAASVSALASAPVSNNGAGNNRNNNNNNNNRRNGNAGTGTTAADSSTPGTLHASYLVAADGAASPVRKALRVPFDGGKPLQHLINIHFKAPGLATSNAVAGMLYFVYNKATISVVVAHDIAAGEYVAQVPYFPEFEPAEKFTDKECLRLVRAAIGNPGADVDILSVCRWTMAAGVARRFRQGRVFLAGDACHHFPPSGAFGMNTGLQDAHNLAWKLAAVIDKSAPASLLDSYELERKPCSQATLNLSMANYDAVLAISAALGADPAHAKLALKVGGAGGLLGALPDSLRTGLLSAAFAAGKGAVLTEQPSLVSKSRLAKVQDMVRNGDGLELLFQDHDLGYVYPSILTRPAQQEKTKASKDADRTAFEPSVRVGARLPHRWLETELATTRKAAIADAKYECGEDHSVGESSKELLSTIDLVSALESGELLFLLWGNDLLRNHNVRQWIAAAEERISRGHRMKIVMCDASTFLEQGSPSIIADVNDSKIQLFSMKPPLSHEDANVFKIIDADGVSAALIRPDNHVAWVATKTGCDAALEHLDKALEAMQITR